MAELDDKTRGQRFVTSLIVLLALAIAIYATSHALVQGSAPSASCEQAERTVRAECPGWRYFARINEAGDIEFSNLDELDWYVGADRAKEVIETLRERADEIDDLRNSLLGVLARIRPLITDKRAVDDVYANVELGSYAEAQQQLVGILSGLSQETYDGPLTRVEGNTAPAKIAKLARLARDQRRDLERLSPPLSALFFWTSPRLSIVEVLFWAFFGVITNLLVNSVEYLRKGTYRPAERWVAYSKLTYGPILATVLVLAIINGWFQVQDYSIRVWSLPLVGFLFGYSSRRTAVLVDRITERFLGKASEGIDAGPEPVREHRRAMVKELMEAYRPRNLGELRVQAKNLADELVTSDVAEREARR